MRWLGIVIVILLASACDNKQEGASGTSGAASASAAAREAGAAPVASPSDEAGPKPQAIPLPERPIPRPQTMVGSGMSIEVQQKAIAYMIAMRAPHPDDVSADPVYASDLATRLKPIVLSMDSGADRRLNRVEIVADGRQIDLLMAGGCDDKTPQRAVTSRAGVSLATLVSHGVLVLRCNDARVQCLQSTRDPEDVLCTTAPRHK